MKKPLGNRGAGAAFNPGLKIGDLVFVSGQIGKDENGKLVSGGIGAETKQAFRNIEKVLKEAGGSMEDLVKTTVYMCDLTDFEEMDKAYLACLDVSVLPTRATVGINSLLKGASVEIEAIAVISPPGVSRGWGK